MTDMKSLLGSAFDDEPPLGFGRDEVLRKGRTQRIRRRAVTLGGAVVGMAVVLFGATTLNAVGGNAPPSAGEVQVASSKGPADCVAGITRPDGTCAVDREPGYTSFDAIEHQVIEASDRGGFELSQYQRAEPEKHGRTMAYKMTKEGGKGGELSFTRAEMDDADLKPSCPELVTCETRVEKVRGVDTEVVIEKSPAGGGGKPSTAVYLRDVQGVQFKVVFDAEFAGEPVFTTDELVKMMTVSVS